MTRGQAGDRWPRRCGSHRCAGRGPAAFPFLCATLSLLSLSWGGCALFRGHEADQFAYEENDASFEEAAGNGTQEGNPRKADAADRAYQAPRTVESVEHSLQAALGSITRRNGYRGLWQAARACAWLADMHPDEARREFYARRGIAIGREALRRAPDRVESAYYLALNLGRYSGLKRTARFLKEMARTAELAIEKDERFDGAGPHRFLGLLHLRTEGKLLVGFGDLDEALRHLSRAVELAPEDPENRLAYAEALLADEEYAEARRQLDAAARAPAPELAGDWKERVAAVREKIAKK